MTEPTERTVEMVLLQVVADYQAALASARQELANARELIADLRGDGL